VIRADRGDKSKDLTTDSGDFHGFERQQRVKSKSKVQNFSTDGTDWTDQGGFKGKAKEG
jgi:hypothetical protein